jgi:hypothetical protein
VFGDAVVSIDFAAGGGLASAHRNHREVGMSILVRFAPPSMTTEQYESVKNALETSGNFPPEGLQLHVCFGPEGSRRVSEIWASREQFDAFATRLMPEIEKAGIDVSTGPEYYEIYTMIQP